MLSVIFPLYVQQHPKIYQALSVCVLSIHNVLYSIKKHDVIITYPITFKQAVNVKASSPYHTLTIYHPQYDWFA